MSHMQMASLLALLVITLSMRLYGVEGRGYGGGGRGRGGGGSGPRITVGYYAKSCPSVERIVFSEMQKAFKIFEGAAPDILRLHFHDCFVRGCDGSVLLNGPNSERFANANGGREGFEIVDRAKAAVENACPSTVSCADIFAYAARDSILLTGGKGAHLIGGSRCLHISNRLYEYPSQPKVDPVLPPKFAKQLMKKCPPTTVDFDQVPPWNVLVLWRTQHIEVPFYRKAVSLYF